MRISRTLLLATIGALATTPAAAEYPLYIFGHWTAVANQTAGTMVLDQPPGQWPGACKRITGSIFGDPLEGRYCPWSGRIVFMRRTAAGTPTQLYQGFVGSSGRPLGGGQYANILRMSGTFMVWNAAGASSNDEGVDFNFTATR